MEPKAGPARLCQSQPAREQAEYEPVGPLDDRVRRVLGPQPGTNGPVRDVDHEWLVPRPNLDRDGWMVGLIVREADLQRVLEPVGLEHVVVGSGREPRGSPDP